MTAISKKRSKDTSASSASLQKPSNSPIAPRQKRVEKKLTAWLRQQAKKLKSLVATEKRLEKRLKVDFVANMRDKGRILSSVRDRLKNTSNRFEDWVSKNTDIGYSTALLWIDVAEHFDQVKTQFADSNPLELTVRQIRDAIRDERQKQGKGKPQSGKKRAATRPISGYSNEPGTDSPTPTKTAEEATYCPRSAEEEDWEKQDDGWQKDGYRICPQKDGKCQVFKGKELIAKAHSEDEALAIVDQDIDEEPDELEQEPNGDNDQSQPNPPPNRSISIKDDFGVRFDAENKLTITEESGYTIQIEANSLAQQIEAALTEYRRGK